MKKFLYIVIFTFIGAFLMQGFQCASPEMTTAKIAIQQKDNTKAKEYLEKELVKNPGNGEAWLLLVQAEENLKDFNDAVESLDKAEQVVKDPVYKDKIPMIKYDLNIKCYNSGIDAYKRYVNSKQQTDFDEAEKYFNLGLKLRPQKVEYYKFLGMLYDLKNDNATAIKYYSNYIKMLAPEFELAKEKKIFINMNRKDAITALGKPIDTKRFKLCEQCDSLLVDDFKVGENDVVLYSNDSKSNLTEFLVGGWRLNLSKSWTAYDKAMGFNFELSPYFNLAQSEFEKKDYDKALDNIYKVLILDPSNSEANSEVVQLLEIQGKKDDAFKYVQGLVKDNPNNPVFITQYADFLAQQEKFDEAIENYEKVLKIKPDYDIVIRNLAVAYKNKVVAIQTAQNDKLEKDPKYVPDKNEYLKYLAKSAEYYEKCRTIKKYSNDYSILADLYEIYLVLGEKEKPKAILAELKAMEPTVPKEDLVNYYKALLKIYDRMGDSQDLQEIQKKFEELSK